MGRAAINIVLYGSGYYSVMVRVLPRKARTMPCWRDGHRAVEQAGLLDYALTVMCAPLVRDADSVRSAAGRMQDAAHRALAIISHKLIIHQVHHCQV